MRIAKRIRETKSNKNVIHKMERKSKTFAFKNLHCMTNDSLWTHKSVESKKSKTLKFETFKLSKPQETFFEGVR